MVVDARTQVGKRQRHLSAKHAGRFGDIEQTGGHESAVADTGVHCQHMQAEQPDHDGREEDSTDGGPRPRWASIDPPHLVSVPLRRLRTLDAFLKARLGMRQAGRSRGQSGASSDGCWAFLVVVWLALDRGVSDVVVVGEERHHPVKNVVVVSVFGDNDVTGGALHS